MSFATPAPRILVENITTVWVRDFAAIVGAVGFIAVMAQIAIPLPFTPVPLTGQTLAVLLSTAALGAWRGIAATSLYLVAALAGAPVLAPQADGSHITGINVFGMASLGYVLGFIVAAMIVGRMAERGFTRTPALTALTMFAGSVAIYAVGVPGLQVVTGADWSTAIAWGLTPFLIGDALKIVIAAGLFPAAWAGINRFLAK
jgi:biotin transport system substrate-specific component